MLSIKWWEPDDTEDDELELLQRYFDNFVQSKPPDVQQYLEEKNIYDLRPPVRAQLQSASANISLLH